MGIFNWVKTLSDNTLYFPGCLTKTFMKEEFENYKKIFDKLDIAYILLEDEEISAGFDAYNAGYKKEVKKWAEKNYELFKKNAVTKIITNSSHVYYMFNTIYPQLIREWDIEVEHTVQTITNALKRKGIQFKGEDEERTDIIYHDACYLGRYAGLYEEPRTILTRLGARIKEFDKHHNHALCSGACGGIMITHPEFARNVAAHRLTGAPDNTTPILSACITAHASFRTVTDRSIELSQFVLAKLKEQGL